MSSGKPLPPSRVLLFHSDLRGAGGAERLLWEEERFFVQKGFEVRVITFTLEDQALFDYTPKDLEVLSAGADAISRIRSLRQELRRYRPKLVVVQNTSDSMLMYVAKAGLRIPCLTHIHGTLFWFPDDDKKYATIFRHAFDRVRSSVFGHSAFIPPRRRFSILERVRIECLGLLNYLAVRNSYLVIVLTEQVQWEVQELYGKEAVVARGCLGSKFLVPKAPRMPRLMHCMRGQRVILSLGRLDKRKRIDLLIRAFGKVAETWHDVHLAIGGTGEEEAALRELVEQLGLVKRVTFLGFIPDSELVDYYRAADVFAFPSWTSSGITPYEALAVGLKVVWTSEASEPVLGGANVFVADPTVESFSEGLDRALRTEIVEDMDVGIYSWSNYFETVLSALMQRGKEAVCQ